MKLETPKDADVQLLDASPADANDPLAARREIPAERLFRLVYHVMDERTLVFAASSEGAVRVASLPAGRAALAADVTRLRQAMGVESGLRGISLTEDATREREIMPAPAGAPEDVSERAGALHRTLIEPLAGVLPADGTPIVIEPHGPLWLLPFTALLAPDGRSPGERFPLLLSPSDEVLAQLRTQRPYRPRAALRALVVGNPAIGKLALPQLSGVVLDALPGAEAEAQAIAKLLPAERLDLFVGAAATRDAVLDAARRCQIIHLATHGIAFSSE